MSQYGSISTHLRVTSRYCPLRAVTKLPYRYWKSHGSSEEVSSEYFANGKFWTRGWTVYYAWTPRELSRVPVLFVILKDVETFIDSINLEMECRFELPTSAEDDGFMVKFDNDPRLSAQQLGHCKSKEALDVLVGNIPQRATTSFSDMSNFLNEKTLRNHVKLLERALDAGRSSNKSSASKTLKDEQHRAFGQHILREAQRFLGLHPPSFQPTSTQPDPFAPDRQPWTDELNEILQEADLRNPLPAKQDLPPPYAFGLDVIFISIDVEAYERGAHMITEIGISTLDTRDLHDVAPGLHAENWHPLIRSRHFRIGEYLHLNNHEFVTGCAHRFDFGTSEIISLKNAPTMVASCFRPPYSKPEQSPSSSQAQQATPENNDESSTPRQIVLVGHDIKNDIQYLQKLGFSLNLSNLRPERVDTVNLFKALKQEQNQRSLGAILHEFDIPPFNLHNAGNDAAFTMQAMLAIALASAMNRSTTVSA